METAARNRRRSAPDAGLALLDTLLGMAIFALIVVIAIQSIGQYRQRAFEVAAMSDARQVGVALLAASTESQTNPSTSLPPATLAAIGANLTKNNSVGGFRVGGGSFAICIQHASGGVPDAYAVFDSEGGAVTDSGRGEGCPSL